MRLFSFFDRKQLGRVSRHDFVQTVTQRIFRERERIIASLTTNSAIIARLDHFLFSGTVLFSTILSSNTFRATVWDSLVTTAATYGIIAILQGALRDTLDDMCFLFLIHPFDIGDVISYDDIGYTVVDMDLTETVLCGPSNQLTYVKNCELSRKPLMNISRSRGTTEILHLPLHAPSTPSRLVYKLEESIKEFCAAFPGDFNPKECLITRVELRSKVSMFVDVQIGYRGNFAEGKSRDERWNALMRWLRERVIPQLGVQLN